MSTAQRVSDVGQVIRGVPFGRARCGCFIVPQDVLERFARDRKLSAAQREAFASTAEFEKMWRASRKVYAKTARSARTLLPTALAAAPPAIPVYDCRNGNSLPGTPIANPGSSTDATAKRVFNETTAIVDFYQSVFGRNSVDDAGKTLLSSIHYSVDYNNAFWNGTQMAYGDGDGQIFLDFTKSIDVMAHEITHGVTQFTAGFNYENEAGGLNESISDVFGTMFRQWRKKQTVDKADWLIGAEIMGPESSNRGYTCLRDMRDPRPKDKHCLAPQVVKYSEYQDGMDPHYSSGIPNLAFSKAAIAVGGKSWENVGKVWYQALAGYAPSPNMKMSAFAKRTRDVAQKMFGAGSDVDKAIDKAWTAVEL